MRKTLKRRARKNRTRKDGVRLTNRIRGLFSRRKLPVNSGIKNILNGPKNILDPPNNNRPNSNQRVESTNRPTLMGSNIIGTINPNIARRYPGNQGPNYAPGFRPPVFGPERNQPPWA
jgi:hypothetical protein